MCYLIALVADSVSVAMAVLRGVAEAPSNIQVRIGAIRERPDFIKGASGADPFPKRWNFPSAPRYSAIRSATERRFALPNAAYRTALRLLNELGFPANPLAHRAKAVDVMRGRLKIR